jgi:16S rRNA (cytidine1402-2'-O)-methyltransferase
MDSNEDDVSTGTLLVAAAPIGRPDDASPRLAAALSAARIIAAEDTRRVRRLAAALGAELTARIVSYYDFDDVETRRAAGLLADLRAGHDVLLVTDAGMPGVSDPGYRVVAAAAAEGIRVSVLPGPSAVTAALAVSGLPTDRFCFEGFPARRAGDRARRFAELATERRTLVFFETARRLSETLAGLAAAFGGDRRAAVCRELTKTHEEVRRGTLAELAGWAGQGLLGEITVVVAGGPARPATAAGPADAAAATAAAVADVAARVRSGLRRNAAITAVARERGLDRGELYGEVARRRNAARGSQPPGGQQPPAEQRPPGQQPSR